MGKIIKISEPVFSSDEIKNLKKVLNSGWLTQGSYVDSFENYFSKIHNVKYSLATTSCTTALHLILVALNIKKNDEVIVPSFTWVSTVNSILYCGAKPVLVDISLETLNASEKEILKKINKKTKVIISIFAGRMADAGIDPIPEFKKSIKASKNFKNVEILWASTREPYNYIQAKQLGCRIITVPPKIIEKIEQFGKSSSQLTLETVKGFINDSKKSKFQI